MADAEMTTIARAVDSTEVLTAAQAPDRIAVAGTPARRAVTNIRVIDADTEADPLQSVTFEQAAAGTRTVYAVEQAFAAAAAGLAQGRAADVHLPRFHEKGSRMRKTLSRLLLVTLALLPAAARADPLTVTGYILSYVGAITAADLVITVATVAWAPCGTAAARRDARRLRAAES